MHLDVETDAIDAIKAFDNRPDREISGQIHILTGIPMIDIVINIDWFTAHFEDRNKVVRIVKELFTHSTSMKTLLKKHGKIVLTILLNKYDQ